MSTMLEQAIIDAKALKEAALKSAEASIIEKYSNEIKDTVQTMLEETEEPADPVNQIPLASTEVDADGDEMVSLDLDGLKDLVQQELSMDLEENPDDMTDRHDFADEVEASEESQEDSINTGMIREEDEIDLTGLLEDESAQKEPAVSDEMIDEIVEKLTLDFHPEKTGWLEKPQYETKMAEDEAEALATHQDEDEEIKSSKLEESLQQMAKENEKLKSALKSSRKQNDRTTATIDKLKNTLNEVNLQNAKLLYTNRTLISDSLNERQKDKIVEAISNSLTVEEAKVIYDTLQSAVGETRSSNRAPESLSEAVTRRSSTILQKKKEVKPASDANLDRMRKLAGIK
jgi:hypothetical protein